MPDFKMLEAEHVLIAMLLILAALTFSIGNILHLVIAPLTAAVLDFLLAWLIDKRKDFPYLGLISGLIIALLLAPNPVFAFVAAVIAMAGKYIIRIRKRNIFNPAAFSLFVMSIFGIVTAWWGVLHWIVIPLGLLVAYKIRRLETSLSFLAVYFIIFFIIKGVLPLEDYTAYFFAFVMVLEPVTSPATRKGKIIFGPAVALLALLLPLAANLPVNLFLGSLLIMNLFTPYLNKLKSAAKPQNQNRA
ncbi:MAG: RnfABCDGE type electron transport complex subunit D [Candidatus Aenigmarchaeota archaeon]|nr:RnfABCDGE type electron transport complex subunit D [Candidatus Aenigmarchaeota archaeon]